MAHHRVLVSALILASLGLVSPSSEAAIITEVTGFGVGVGRSIQLVDPGSTTGVNGTTRTVAGFDSSLGTLTGVAVFFTTSWQLRSSFEVRDPTTGFFDEDNVAGAGEARHRLTIDLIDPNGGQQTVSMSVGSGCSDNDGYCFDNDLRSGTFNGSLSVLGIPLASFLAPDPISFTMTDTLQAIINSCPDTEDQCRETASSSWSGTISVRYTYAEPTPTGAPEPVSSTMLGLGLCLGCVLMQARNRARARRR